MAPQIKVSNFKDIPNKVGLKDGGHVILKCSACNEPLVDIWITRAEALDRRTGKPLEWKGKAMCWACGDASFPVTWHGSYALGSFGIDIPNPDPDGMDDSKITSKVVRVETQGDLLIFHTMKGD